MSIKIKQQQNFTEKFSLLSTAIRWLISVIILILIILIGYYFDTRSQIKTLKQLKAKEVYLNNDLASKNDLIKQQDITKHKIALMEQYINQNQISLNQNDDQGYIVEKLHDMSAKQQIQFSFIKPQQKIVKAFYSILPISIEATGDYHHIAKFLSGIANLDSPIIITDFSLKRDSKNQQSVNLELIGNIFSLDPNQIKTKYYPEAVNKNSTEKPVLPKPAATAHYTESKKRNPFTSIQKTQTKNYANVILSSSPLSEIQLVGIIEQGNRKWAIIMPIGKNDDRITHKVTIGNRISQSNALIKKIYDDHISLQEDVGDNKKETVTLNVDDDS